MTYCNMQYIGRNGRKPKKQPSVSLWAIENELRKAEIESYRERPDTEIPITFKNGRPLWPQKF